MAEKILFERNDFYALDDFEKVYKDRVCRCDCHHLEWYILEELELCCRTYQGDRYLITVDGKDYILKEYADKLLEKQLQDEINCYKTYRLCHNIELDYRTPKHVHGKLEHEIYPPEKHKHKQK